MQLSAVLEKGVEYMNDIVPANNRQMQLAFLGFIANYSERAKKTVYHNIKHFVEFLNQLNVSVNDISQSVVSIYFDYLRQQNISGGTINLKASNVSVFLKALGYKDINIKRSQSKPYDNTKMISLEALKNIIRYLDEQKKIPGKKNIKYLRDSIIFRFLMLSGCRKSEITQLRYSSISQTNGTYYYQTKLKGGRSITKELPTSVLEDILLLQKLEGKSSEDLIFTSIYSGNKKQLSDYALNRILNLYNFKVNKSKETLSIHSIRNLSAKVLYENTQDLLLVRRHLNHSSAELTRRYIEKMVEKEVNYYGTLEDKLKDR